MHGGYLSVEDAAEALGQLAGEALTVGCSVGAVGTLSFNGNKLITTTGEWGRIAD